MKILVCISKTPDTTTKISFKDNNTTFDTSNVQYIINPYDEWYALVRAIELKEQNGGTVTTITVGTASGISRCLQTVTAHRVSARDVDWRRGRRLPFCRRRHSHRRVIVAKPLDRLGAGWYGPRGLRGFCGLRGLHSLFGERWSRAGAKGAPRRTPCVM